MNRNFKENEDYKLYVSSIESIIELYKQDKSNLELLTTSFYDNVLRVISHIKNIVKVELDYELNLSIMLNTTAMKPFGLFIMDEVYSDINTYLDKLASEKSDLKFSNKVKVEIDYLLFKNLDAETIAEILLLQICIFVKSTYLEELSFEINSRISKTNSIIRSHYTNSILSSLFILIDYNIVNNVIYMLKLKIKDQKFDIFSLYDKRLVDTHLNSILSNIDDTSKCALSLETLQMRDPEHFNQLYKIITNPNPDFYIYRRLEEFYQKSEIKLFKDLVSSYMASMDKFYDVNHIRVCNESKCGYNNRTNHDLFIESITDAYKKAKRNYKRMTFNSLYDTYYNRYFELNIKSKHISSEYDTLLVMRDINTILAILDEYLREHQNMPSTYIEKLETLILMYRNLRTEIVNRDDIPKYSGLSLWSQTPIDGYN